MCVCLCVSVCVVRARNKGGKGSALAQRLCASQPASDGMPLMERLDVPIGRGRREQASGEPKGAKDIAASSVEMTNAEQAGG